MSERIGLIGEWLEGDSSVSELAVAYGISRKTVYKWLERYEAAGWEALQDQSRAPDHHPNAVAPEIEIKLLELKAAKPLWGAPKLRRKLLGLVGQEHCPAESTLSQMLRRHGLSARPRRRGHAVPSQEPLAHAQACNKVWCADFKGWFRTGDGRKCYPLTITDAHSRYLLCCEAIEGQTGWVTVHPLMVQVFREYGLPEALRTDNGPPFASSGLGGLSLLSVWWVRLGIRLERIAPGHPQENGRHERMHRTLKEATANPPRASGRAQQKAFDQFVREYNQERPHEALNQEPPASVYAPSLREYPERLPEQKGYPQGWEKRAVGRWGQMKWQGRDLPVSSALWGQEVGLEPVSEGLWRVHFEDLILGVFDERTGQIKPARKLERAQPTDEGK